MPRKKHPDEKVDALRQEGSLNPHPESVTDPLFQEHEFFDARDALQVKYEMLRRVRAEGQSVKQTTDAFGFSRPSFYRAKETFDEEGLPGLIPKKRGPRGAHKLSKEIMNFIEEILQTHETASSAVLAQRVKEEFDVAVHARSIERALARKKKRQ